jgi:hypothetical protein
VCSSDLAQLVSFQRAATVKATADSDDSHFDVDGTLIYGNNLTAVRFRVSVTGEIDMVEDRIVLGNLPVVTDHERDRSRLALKVRPERA